MSDVISASARRNGWEEPHRKAQREMRAMLHELNREAWRVMRKGRNRAMYPELDIDTLRRIADMTDKLASKNPIF